MIIDADTCADMGRKFGKSTGYGIVFGILHIVCFLVMCTHISLAVLDYRDSGITISPGESIFAALSIFYVPIFILIEIARFIFRYISTEDKLIKLMSLFLVFVHTATCTGFVLINLEIIQYLPAYPYFAFFLYESVVTECVWYPVVIVLAYLLDCFTSIMIRKNRSN